MRFGIGGRASRQLPEWTHVAIAQSPPGLDIVGTFRFAQGFAYAADGFAEALVVDLLAIPKPFQQLLAVDHAVPVFNEAQQYLVGFALQGNTAGADGQQLVIRVKGCGA